MLFKRARFYLSLYLVFHDRCLWFVSRSMADEESDRSEEIDMKPLTFSIATEWRTQIGNGNSLLIPQQLPDLSRTNSKSSSDYQIINNQETDTPH